MKCVAWGCDNIPQEGLISVHKFPKSAPDILRQWVKFVETKRKDWTGPSPYTGICSAHFKESDFDQTYMSMKRLGIKSKATLREAAVPSIHVIPESGEPPRKKPRKNSSLRKRCVGQVGLNSYSNYY